MSHHCHFSTSDEINIVQPRTRRFMSTNTVSNESLRYVEPHEIPVIQYNSDRRGSLLDPEIEYPDKSKYKTSVVKRIVPQCGKRLAHRNSDNSLDLESPYEGRKFSDVNPTTQATFDRLLSQLSKTEEEDVVSFNLHLADG